MYTYTQIVDLDPTKIPQAEIEFLTEDLHFFVRKNIKCYIRENKKLFEVRNNDKIICFTTDEINAIIIVNALNKNGGKENGEI